MTDAFGVFYFYSTILLCASMDKDQKFCFQGFFTIVQVMFISKNFKKLGFENCPFYLMRWFKNRI